jgi:alpha-L-fucosidase
MKKRQIPLLLLTVNFCFCACSNTGVPPPAPVFPIPTEAQLEWHRMELNAFIHFTTNTFTDLEWGFGDESPMVFNPTELNAGQWAKNLKEVGFIY